MAGEAGSKDKCDERHKSKHPASLNKKEHRSRIPLPFRATGWQSVQDELNSAAPDELTSSR